MKLVAYLCDIMNPKTNVAYFDVFERMFLAETLGLSAGTLYNMISFLCKTTIMIPHSGGYFMNPRYFYYPGYITHLQSYVNELPEEIKEKIRVMMGKPTQEMIQDGYHKRKTPEWIQGSPRELQI